MTVIKSYDHLFAEYMADEVDKEDAEVLAAAEAYEMADE